MSTLQFPSGACVVVELGYVSSVRFDMRLEVSVIHTPPSTGVEVMSVEFRKGTGSQVLCSWHNEARAYSSFYRSEGRCCGSCG